MSLVIALPLRAAAAAVGFSTDTLRRAIQSTDPSAFPPPLRAKKDSKGRYSIKVVDLEAWFDSLEDA